MNRLIELEALIVRSRDYFYDVGRALKEIRDKRLYKKALFETFGSYVKARWDMGRAHAYRLIAFYEVIRNLSPIGDILPTNESQARPLARFTPHQQRRLWKDFLKSGSEQTALSIKKFIDALKTEPKNSEDLTDRITQEYMVVVKAMMEQVRVSRQDHWQSTSRQAALLWNRVIREMILKREAHYG
jgi:hypothetical protein